METKEFLDWLDEIGVRTAFDVFSVDTANRKIYAVRVGAGSDREWSY